MKLKILFDNYYSYMLVFAFISILKYVVFNENINFGIFFVLGLLWLSDLIFEKKMYLLNLKINEIHIEVTYLDIFLNEKIYIKERVSINSINYLNKKSLFKKFEVLQIVEKKSFNILDFKIIGNHTKENVKEKIG